MTKDLTFHINNKAYTISGDEELERNNQDMILKIDSTLTLIKANTSD